MPELSFSKYQGLGNDFVIFDGIANPDISLTSKQARKIADRRLGIGADQILLLKEAGDEFSYQIWNQDGGEVAQCGNGARSAHAFLRQKGYAKNSRTILRTTADLIEVEDGETGPRAHLGVPCFEEEKIPHANFSLKHRPIAYEKKTSSKKVRISNKYCYEVTWKDKQYKLFVVFLGNPHCVIQTENVEEAPVHELGKELNSPEHFSEGINVSFATFPTTDSLELRVYERGVGETPACGSAAAACAVINHDFKEEIAVDMAGGRLLAGWKGGGNMAWVEGKVEHVFDGIIDMA